MSLLKNYRVIFKDVRWLPLEDNQKANIEDIFGLIVPKGQKIPEEDVETFIHTKVTEMLENDSYESEKHQMQSQCASGSIAYFRFEDIDSSKDWELVFFYGTTEFWRKPLKELCQSKKHPEIKEFKLEFQASLNLLIVQSVDYYKEIAERERHRERESGFRHRHRGFMGMGFGDDDFFSRERNPFKTVIDRGQLHSLISDNYAQDAIVNGLINCFQESQFLEYMIKIGNVFFFESRGYSGHRLVLARENIDEWNFKLQQSIQQLRRVIPFEPLVADKFSKLEESDLIKAIQNRDLEPFFDFSFPKYYYEQVTYFEESNYDHIKALFPNRDLNARILFGLKPQFFEVFQKKNRKRHFYDFGMDEEDNDEKNEKNIKAISFFIQFMAHSPENLLRYMSYAFKTYSTSIPARNYESNLIDKVLEFYELILKNNLKDLARVIESNDTLRRLYFEAIGEFSQGCTGIIQASNSNDEDEFTLILHKNEAKVDYSMRIVEVLLMKPFLSKVVPLKTEFYNIVLKDKDNLKKMTKEFFQDYLENNDIASDDRLKAIRVIYQKQYNSQELPYASGVCKICFQILYHNKKFNVITPDLFLKILNEFYLRGRKFSKDPLANFMMSKELDPILQSTLLGMRLIKDPPENMVKTMETIEQSLKPGSDHLLTGRPIDLLYRDLQAMLTNISNDIKVKYLLTPEVLFPEKMFLLEVFYEKGFNTKDKLTYVKGKINDHIQVMKDISNEFNVYLQNLTKNQAFLSKFDFYNEMVQSVIDLKEKKIEMSIQELKSKNAYHQVIVLNQTDFWNRFHECMLYKNFNTELSRSVPSGATLDLFVEHIKVTMENFKNQFLTFTDPTKYSMADYNHFLPRISYPENLAIYQSMFTSLDIPDGAQKELIKYSMVLHAVTKAIKIVSPMTVISQPDFLKLKADGFTKTISKIETEFKNVPPQELTIQKVLTFDRKNTKILNPDTIHSSMLYLMPLVIQNLAKSLNCYTFIRQNADAFIKNMREECDNEFIDIVNKLDVLNKHLNQLDRDQTFEQVVIRMLNISKTDQTKVKAYLSDINPQMKKIYFLASKTKKNQAYTQQTIEAILADSTISIKYNQKERKFKNNVIYSKDGNNYEVSAMEFEEIHNKSKIIVSSALSKDDTYTQLMSQFRNLGLSLETFLVELFRLRELGVIRDDMGLLLPFLGQNCQGKMNLFATQKNDSKVLEIKYNSREVQQVIETANDALKKVRLHLEAELKKYYCLESYLLTYFHGKSLYYLTQYLKGQNKDIQKEETLALLTESFSSHSIDFNSQPNFPPALQDTFAGVFHNLKIWSKEIINKRKLKPGISTVFASEKIKICSTPCLNVYQIISKIIYEAKESMINLSQLLFCTRETTKYELLAFCNRALLDPFQRMYFVLNIEQMDYLTVMEMKNIFLDIFEQNQKNMAAHGGFLNYNILIFNVGDTQSHNIFDNEYFEKVESQIEELDKKIEDEQYQQALAHLFEPVKIVSSEMAGMGKTQWIKNNMKSNLRIYDLLVSGTMNRMTINKRLQNFTDFGETNDAFSITIKLDFIENFERQVEDIDYLLFCLCIIRSYYTAYGCNNIKEKLFEVFIEISNTSKVEMLSLLSFFRLFKTKEGDFTKNWVSLPKFAFKSIYFNKVSGSNEQIVGNFLNAISKNTINITPVVESTTLVDISTYHSLLAKYYGLDFLNPRSQAERENSTYSQYQFWLMSLASLIKNMEQVEKFAPNEKNESDGLRAQVATEILRFANFIISVSVEQARTSQETMKEIMPSLMNKNIVKINVDSYQERFTKIVPWSSDTLMIPLMKDSRTLFALTDIVQVFNQEKLPDGKPNPRYRERIDLRNFINTSGNAITSAVDPTSQDHSEVCLALLGKYLGKNDEEIKQIIEKATKFKNKGFVVTLENFMKICLIMLKADLKVPIIMMGESGCGKTYLSQFVSEGLLDEELMDLTLYSGVTEEEFIEFLKKAVSKAKKIQKDGKRLWVFFDEFNTSSLQSIVAEIMIERICSIELSIYNIPTNIVFIACCNPFRMKTKKSDIGLAPKTVDTLLSHRVYPVPERLLNYTWDFGQLSESDEKKHIMSMVRSKQIFDPKDINLSTRFVNALYGAHKIVRDIEERSGVSLRDIERVIKLYIWFKKRLQQLVTDVDIKKYKNSVHIRAIICALSVAYCLRLNGRDDSQERLYQEMTKRLKYESTLQPFNKVAIKKTLADVSSIYLDALIKERPELISNDIALNKPLKENFIAMLSCFDSMTPLIICGAPGTSKTLCTQIFSAAMDPTIIKDIPHFEGFKGFYPISYGGSQTSTSEGISYAFERGKKYLKDKGENTPVVVFDEVGLAELSPFNPLKILHPLLEKPDQKIGFFGLSNWTLDLSKMNRLIYLARPDMTHEDLVEIFNISIDKCGTPEAKNTMKTLLVNLSRSYLIFREWQKKYCPHPNFHGSRDIYGLSRKIYNDLTSTEVTHNTEFLKNMVKNSIERNLSGAMYKFSEDGISFDTIKNLQSSKEGSSFKNIRIEELGSVYSQPKVNNSQQSQLFSSSQVFKQIFTNLHSESSSLSSLDLGSSFLEDQPVMDLVTQNIQDPTSRFLLIKSEGDSVDNMFMGYLAQKTEKSKIRDWRGMKGKENSYELLSTLKSYITLGYVVVMKNLDELYGSLYDLFNQKFSKVDGKNQCDLFFGGEKHKVEVHPNFKAIILLSAEDELEGNVIEIDQPAPFLNRFEKFFLRVSNLLDEQGIMTVKNLIEEMRGKTDGFIFKYVCLTVDMIFSILNQQKTDSITNKSKENMVMRLATSNVLLSDNLSSKELEIFQKEHPYASIFQLLRDMNMKPAQLTTLFTFSNPIEVEFIRTQIEETTKCTFLLSENLIKQGLEIRADLIKKVRTPFLVVQFVTAEHLALVSQLKANIQDATSLKKVLLIVHLDKFSCGDSLQGTGLNYYNGWENYVLEDINNFQYKEYTEAYDLTLAELVLSGESAFGNDILKEVIVSAVQRIILEKNDENMRRYLNELKCMIQNDESGFIKLFKLKLNQSNLFSDVPELSEKWRNLVVKECTKTDTYIDLKTQLHKILNNKAGNIVRDCVYNLNNTLENLSSYAIMHRDSDPELRKLFKTSFEKGFNEVSFSARTTYSSTFYHLAYLKNIYHSTEKNFAQMIKRNKNEFQNLVKIQVDYSENHKQHTQNAEIVNNMKDSVLRGEEFFLTLVPNTLQELFQCINRDYIKTFKNPKLFEKLLLDLVYMMLKTSSEENKIKGKQGSESQDQFLLSITKNVNYFFEICRMILKNSTGQIEVKELSQFVTCVFILVISFKQDLTFIFSLIAFSNIRIEEFKNVVNQKRKGPNEDFKFDLSVLKIIISDLQNKVIPDLRNSSENLSSLGFVKNRYSEILAECSKADDTISKNYDIKYIIILLDLLDILPPQEQAKIRSELSDLQKHHQRTGNVFDVSFIKTSIEKGIRVFMDLKDFDRNSLALIINEYIMMNANCLDFSFFNSNTYDAVFDKFDTHIVKMISATFASHLCNKLMNFYTLEDLESVSEMVPQSKGMETIDEALQNLDYQKERNGFMVISFIDKLTYMVSEARPTLELEEILEISKYIIDNNDFNNPSISLESMMQMGMLRAIYTEERIKTMFSQTEKKSEVDEVFKGIVISVENLATNINSFPLIYFTQAIVNAFGQISPEYFSYQTILKASQLLLEEDLSSNIAFFSPEIQAHSQKLHIRLSDAIMNNKPDVFKAIFEEKFKGNLAFSRYMIGVTLINKFVMSKASSDQSILLCFEEMFIKLFENIQCDAEYKKLLLTIIRNDKFNFGEHLTSAGSKSEISIFENRLKKLFYQFLLLVYCFKENFGYDTDFWKQWIKGKFVNSKLKCQLVGSDRLNNYCSIMSNIITERLGDGSYQDYGANLSRNLGVYRCSCLYMYSIGNCGYAVEDRPCPVCKKLIGGRSHSLLQREGHIHLKTLESINAEIQKEYDSLNSGKVYKPHTILNKECLESLPLKLNENSMDSLIKMMKNNAKTLSSSQKTNAETESTMKEYEGELSLRHLFDHMLIIAIPEILPDDQSISFKESLKGLLPYQDPKFKEIFGSIAGNKINNHNEYFLAHIKNDLETLSKYASFRNPTDIFDFMRALLSKMSEKFLAGNKLTEKKLLLDGSQFENAGKLISYQAECIRIQNEEKPSETTILKNIFMRKENPDRILQFFVQNGRKFNIMYRGMRHNSILKQEVLKEFQEQVRGLQNYSLIQEVVNYDNILKDFPRIVSANLELPHYINTVYQRQFDYDETVNMKITDLDDPHLKELFKSFRDVWENKVPLYEDTHPGVFSFALLCQQDLNVRGFIEDIIKHKKENLIKFLFVSPFQFEDSLDFIYMKSIIYTFVEKFHNEFIRKVNKVLNLDSENSKNVNTKTISNCHSSDFVSDCKWEEHVLNNFWYDPSVDKENQVSFNFDRIQYLCAQEMKKPLILAEKTDMAYYDFKKTNITEAVDELKNLFQKIQQEPLSPEQLENFSNLNEKNCEKTWELLIEISNYVLKNFLFNNSNLTFEEVVTHNKAGNALNRFSAYEKSLHAKLQLCHFENLFEVVETRRFTLTLLKEKYLFSQPLEQTQLSALQAFAASQPQTKVAELKLQYQNIVKEYYSQGEQFRKLSFDMVGFETDLFENGDVLGSCVPSQYFEIMKVLDKKN